MGDQDRITPEEAAVLIGRSVQTIRKWERETRLHAERVLGRVYFSRAEVLRLRELPRIPSAAPVKSRRK